MLLTNTTPATALPITSLPYSVTVAEADLALLSAGTGYVSTCDSTQYRALWWKVTTAVDDIDLGIQATASNGSGNYNPNVSIWTGTPPSLTEVVVGSQEICGSADWFNVPVDGATTYYIQVTTTHNGAPGTDLLLKVRLPPTESIPAGSILITDDTDGFPAVIVDAVTGEVLRVVDLPACEAAATLPTGEFCLPRANNDATLTKQTAIYGGDLQLIATQDWSPDRVAGISSNSSDTFYVLTSDPDTGIRTLHAVRATGVLGDSWTGFDGALRSFCVSPDDSILYYKGQIGDTNRTIYRHDLVNDVPLTDLYTPGVGWEIIGTGQPDSFTGADGSVFFVFKPTGSNQPAEIRRISAAGALLNTYGPYLPAVGGVRTPGDFANLNHVAPVDATSFEIWGFSATAFSYDGTLSLFQRIRISDGAILSATPAVSTQGTSGNGGIPGVAFSISNSCPLLVLRADVASTTCGVVLTDMTYDCVTGLITITGSGFHAYTQVVLHDPLGHAVPLTFLEPLSSGTLHAVAYGIRIPGEYCVFVTDPAPPLAPLPGYPPPGTPPGPPVPPVAPPGGCVPLTSGGIPGAPAWYVSALIAQGATTCFDMAKFLAVEGDANAHNMMVQRGLLCNTRARLIEAPSLDTTFCSHPAAACILTGACGINHNTEHLGGWWWD